MEELNVISEQWYRCTNCDFCGPGATFNEEDEEYECSYCGHVCNEYEPMTKEDDTLVEDFFSNSSLILPKGNKVDDGHWSYVFDDNKEVNRIMEENPSYFIYTVVDCDGDETWIYAGGRLVNRMGYIISSKEIKIEDDCFRFC